MAKTPVAAATGPIQFLDGARQISVPLTALYFEDGVLKSESQLQVENKMALEDWLRHLVEQGLVRPRETPPKQVLQITAKNPGSTGNDISIAFAKVREDPADAARRIFDATLTQTDEYPDLTKDTITDVLGSESGFDSGSRPGLVFVSSSKVDPPPKAGTYPASNTGVVTVPKDEDPAFELKYRVSVAGAKASVQVSNVSSDAGTFSLTATWIRAATGISASELAKSFSDHVTVAKPDEAVVDDADDGDVPAPGIVALSGGSDAPSPQKASTVVVGVD